MMSLNEYNFLTYSSDHQELPEKQQQVGDFIEHHNPGGWVDGGVSLSAVRSSLKPPGSLNE